MANKNSNVKGTGRISISKVNSKDQCILLSYSISGISDTEQAKTICNKITDLIPDDAEIKFILQQNDWRGDSEKIVLSTSIKACSSEKKAHTFKKEIDAYIKKIGGQTTLDESLGISS